jgi:ribosome-associated protein
MTQRANRPGSHSVSPISARGHPRPARHDADDPRSHAPEPSTRAAVRTPADTAPARAGAIEIARALDDSKCHDIVVLDVTGLSPVSDFLVIASGTSDRQMRSAGDDAADAAELHGFPVHRRSTDERTTWIVLDCIDVVVHVFEPNTRAHYDLEMLWGDAPSVEWERPDSDARSRPGAHRRIRA